MGTEQVILNQLGEFLNSGLVLRRELIQAHVRAVVKLCVETWSASRPTKSAITIVKDGNRG